MAVQSSKEKQRHKINNVQKNRSKIKIKFVVRQILTMKIKMAFNMFSEN